MIQYVIASSGFDELATSCVSSGAFLRFGNSLISKIGPAAVSNDDENDQQWFIICNGLTEDQKQHFNITSETNI
jgi:hypothetical protein